MPAELTTTARYPCEHAGCTRRFGWKAAREQHYHEAHATSRNPLDAFPTISEALSKDDNYRDLESLKSENLSDDSQASSEATKAELKLKCTYVDCDQLFSSEEDMIKHKIDASEHDYCAICPSRDGEGYVLYDEDGQPLYGVDCGDWDDFVKHKIENPHHRSCPVCGQDFKSKAGLRHHVKSHHPKQQTIICPGCDTLFSRAMSLIQHFEWGMCYNRKKPRAGISKQQFNDQVVRKAMIKYLLDDVAPESEIAPSTDASALASNTPADEKVRRLGSSAVQPRDEGVFLDKPMEEMAQLKRHLSPKKANPQGFAGLGAGLALDAIPSLVPTQAVQTNGQRAVLSRKSTNSPWSFEAQKRAIDAQYNRMFAPSPPSEAPKPRLLRHPIVENAMDLGIELFKTRFWDPEDKDFSIEVFWNKIKSIYMCPYPTCDNKSKTQDEFVAHLKKPHTLRRVRCPACAKSFPTCSALIGHCESTSARCRIRHSRMLKEVMDSYSGGILSVKDKPSFRDEQWGDALRVHSMHDILERERQDPARHLRGGDEVTLQAQQPQIYW